MRLLQLLFSFHRREKWVLDHVTCPRLWTLIGSDPRFELKVFDPEVGEWHYHPHLWAKDEQAM